MIFSTLRFIRHFVTILVVLLFIEVFGITFAPPPVVAHTGISFGAHERQSMDIFYPKCAKKINEPVGAFLFIHGGSWTAGSKQDSNYFAIPMAREGYVAASTNYRLRPRFDDEGVMTREGFTVADMMEDIGLAIAKLRATAEKDGIEISSVALFGDSAGGHLALLYAYHYQNQPGNAPAIPISFVVARVAPTDVNFPDDDSMDASILNAVTADAPPTIILHSSDDELVDFERHAIPLRNKLTELGVPFEYFTFEHGGHAMLDIRELPNHKISYDAVFAFACKYF